MGADGAAIGKLKKQAMIEIIEGLPEYVVGLVVKGRLTQKTASMSSSRVCENRASSTVSYGSIMKSARGFPGAAWQTIDLRLEHELDGERVAIVTPTSPRCGVRCGRFACCGQVRSRCSRPPRSQGLAWITPSCDLYAAGVAALAHRRRCGLFLPIGPVTAGHSSFRPPPRKSQR
jgi:hypothetical protein